MAAWWAVTNRDGWVKFKKFMLRFTTEKGIIKYEFPLWYIVDDVLISAGIPMEYIFAFVEGSPKCHLANKRQVLPWVDITWPSFVDTYVEMIGRHGQRYNTADEMLRHYQLGLAQIIAEMRAGVKHVRYDGILLERFADEAQVTVEHVPSFCRRLGYAINKNGAAYVIVDREEERLG
jgi:hypothetical protein